jgi:hypothetical protein
MALSAIILLIGLAVSLTSDWMKTRQFRRDLEKHPFPEDWEND